jgi:hypothetical protein
MLEQKVRVLSEALARGVDRRTFLRRAGGAIVSGVAALVMGPALSNQADKASASPLIPNVANCGPPGPYCNLDGQNEPNGCRGASCFQHVSSGQLLQCQVFYIYQVTGCWTTVSGNGYWTCCDCTCTNGAINASCGCAQYSRAGEPYPDIRQGRSRGDVLNA